MKPRTSLIPFVALCALLSCTSSSTPRARTTLPPRAAPSSRKPTVTPSPPSLARLPYVVERAAGAVIGNTGYMLGGLIPGDNSISTILAVDLNTGAAKRVGTLPIAVHDAAAAPYGSDVLLFGGSDPSGTLVQRFDPATGNVTTIGHLPRVLSDLAAVSIGGTVYVVGGFDGTRARREVLQTTNGHDFKTIATLPTGLRYAAVAAAGSKLIIAGGQTQSAPASRSIYLVDTASGSVRRLATLPVSIAHAVLLVRGDSAFLIGGRDSAGRPTARVWRITTSTGVISASTPLAIPLADPTLMTNGTRAILAGGATGVASSGGETNVEIPFT
jgi:N-acetylneuraminic acid mutarotase